MLGRGQGPHSRQRAELGKQGGFSIWVAFRCIGRPQAPDGRAYCRVESELSIFRRLLPFPPAAGSRGCCRDVAAGGGVSLLFLSRPFTQTYKQQSRQPSKPIKQTKKQTYNTNKQTSPLSLPLEASSLGGCRTSALHSGRTARWGSSSLGINKNAILFLLPLTRSRHTRPPALHICVCVCACMCRRAVQCSELSCQYMLSNKSNKFQNKVYKWHVCPGSIVTLGGACIL